MMFNVKALAAALVCLQLSSVVHSGCFQDVADCEPYSNVVINCYDCSCNSLGTYLECCFNHPKPTKMTSGCVAVLNSETCEYDVFNPDNPDAECSVFAAVGR